MMPNKSGIIHPKLSYQINGILFAVHNDLGSYCNEKQYGDCIERYLKKENLKYEREKVLPPAFKGEAWGRNRLDFYIEGVEGGIILEVKIKRAITKGDYYQVRRYLAAMNLKLGILVNFRGKYIAPKRILNSQIKS